MIYQILSAIIITSLVVNGLLISTGEGMLLEPLKKFLDSIFIRTHKTTLVPTIDKRAFIEERRLMAEPEVMKIYYPILYCVRCMPSVYGTIISLLFFPVNWELLIIIPMVVLASVALSTILNQLYA